jgi:hypothetical protein
VACSRCDANLWVRSRRKLIIHIPWRRVCGLCWIRSCHQRGVRRDTSRKQGGLVGTIQKTHIGGRRTSSHSSHSKANSRRISPLPLAVYLSLFYVAGENSALKFAHQKLLQCCFEHPEVFIERTLFGDPSSYMNVSFKPSDMKSVIQHHKYGRLFDMCLT